MTEENLMQDIFVKTLIKEDFKTKAGATIFPSGSDVEIADAKAPKDAEGFFFVGRHTVPPKLAYAFGHPHNMGSGIVYIRLDSTGGGQIKGKARIRFTSPTENNRLQVLASQHSDMNNPSAPTDRMTNPTYHPSRKPIWLLENGFVELWFKPDVPTDTPIDVSDADNKIMIPITWTPHSGRKGEEY